MKNRAPLAPQQKRTRIPPLEDRQREREEAARLNESSMIMSVSDGADAGVTSFSFYLNRFVLSYLTSFIPFFVFIGIVELELSSTIEHYKTKALSLLRGGGATIEGGGTTMEVKAPNPYARKSSNTVTSPHRESSGGASLMIQSST
jgi:hypothetical protein